MSCQDTLKLVYRIFWFCPFGLLDFKPTPFFVLLIKKIYINADLLADYHPTLTQVYQRNRYVLFTFIFHPWFSAICCCCLLYNHLKETQYRGSDNGWTQETTISQSFEKAVHTHTRTHNPTYKHIDFILNLDNGQILYSFHPSLQKTIKEYIDCFSLFIN